MCHKRGGQGKISEAIKVALYILVIGMGNLYIVMDYCEGGDMCSMFFCIFSMLLHIMIFVFYVCIVFLLEFESVVVG